MLSGSTKTSPLKQNYRRNLAVSGLVSASFFVILWLIYKVYTDPILGNDYAHYLTAVQALLLGQNPYKLKIAVPLVNPLWNILPYLWLGNFSHSSGILVWTTLNLLLIIGVFWFTLQLVDLPIVGWGWLPAFAATLILVRGGWVSSQPTILIALILSFSLWLWDKQEKIWLSGLVGFIFLCFKPQLTAILAVVLLCWCYRKDLRRYWLGAAISFGSGLAITLLFVPSWVTDYLQTFQTERAGFWAGLQTATLLDWLYYNFEIKGEVAWTIYIIWASLGLFTLLWFFRQARQHRLGLVELVALTLAISMAITLYTRDYDYSLLIIPVFYCFSRLVKPETRLALKISGLAVLAGCIIFYFIGGYMYQLYLINFSVGLLTSWCCWEQTKSKIAHYTGQTRPQI